MAETNEVTMSMKDLQGMMERLIRLTKEPSAREAKELQEIEEKEARFRKSRQQAIENQEMERRAREIQQERCSHKKENGKWATGGQIIGGRYGMLICQKCFKTWFADFSQEVINQLNSGDLTLHQADPTQGWKDKQPQEAVA